MAIATLIAAGRLDDRLIDRALGLLREVDSQASFAQWIDDGDAADLRFTGDLRQARWALSELEGLDLFVQEEEPRFRRLFVADMDSTIIGQECIDELADYIGVKDRVAEITERAMQGELDFPGALRERVALLGGLEVAAIDQCLAERVTPNPGAKTLVQTMRVGGAQTLLVSGGFTAFAEPVGQKVGFNRVKANVLGHSGGRLSGLVEGGIVDAVAKRETLIEAREAAGLRPADVLAIGDGANDKLMVEEAGLGVAYRAKPPLAEVADARLDHHGLDALLWAQGIRRKDWVQAG
ncbi:phosphoserine phosphatase SerB [Sphingomonas piscis]|uniref:Phosphoserine phosphatase n=1 Tax=Sphingomonas piscis TaxID=2714943 RepID=A0A6G7YS43_9SPHN|nr:phosphoserine phosphatase SerB [Sphingomonas piscis]QIK79554.1 phosphoserine phosphatase SerB [Sphingomonas piscis]